MATHAEVNNEECTALETKEDELPSPARLDDARSADGPHERLGLGMPHHRREAQVAVDDGATDQVRPQVRDDGLDLW